MFVANEIDKSSKEAFYEQLREQVHHLIAGEENDLANLSNVSSLLMMQLENVNWVGFYLWYREDEELILGPFQGKPACIRIKAGKGVCGMAYAEQKQLIVPDVFSFPGHITCDPDSRSEVVTPILVGGRNVGVLDIDSAVKDRFDEVDGAGLMRIVDELVQVTKFPDR